jgi:hypothetical protein
METAVVKKTSNRFGRSVLYGILGIIVAFIGRMIVDWIAGLSGGYEDSIQYYGGNLVAFIAVWVSIFPILKIYGVIEPRSDKKA